MKPFVQWYLTGHGYAVTAYGRDGQPVKEYTAGDHPLDSQSVAVNDRPVPAATLEKWAQQSAAEMADELGVPRDRISRDTDNEAECKESNDAR
jgi:hypothetical protein